LFIKPSFESTIHESDEDPDILLVIEIGKHQALAWHHSGDLMLTYDQNPNVSASAYIDLAAIERFAIPLADPKFLDKFSRILNLLTVFDYKKMKFSNKNNRIALVPK